MSETNLSTNDSILSTNNSILSTNDSILSTNDSILSTNDSIFLNSLVLFKQDYSEIGKLPSNIFLVNWMPQNAYIRWIEKFCSYIHGNNKCVLRYNHDSRLIEFLGYQTPTLFDYPPISNLISILTRASSSFIIRFKHLVSKSCYMCGLVPMTRCTYRITLGFKTETDDQDSFVEINSPGAKIRLKSLKNGIIKIISIYIDSKGKCVEKALFIQNKTNKITIYIKFDGINKTNAIFHDNSCYIITPFYDYQRQSLPYPDISNSWIKFTHYFLGASKYLELEIFEITQFSKRELITPIGYTKAVPFGLDGPHPLDTIKRGIELTNKNGCSGTLWFDIKYLDSYNDSQMSYLSDLVKNESWEVGIHFSKELNKLTLNKAYALMREEYNLIKNKIGSEPKTWCSLNNSDNINHCIFAYKEFKMVWRNGESGVHGEPLGGIGNLMDHTWQWWKLFSETGMIHPVFTHRTDEQPALDWSISYDKFDDFINNYRHLNVLLIPFGKWWKINGNTYDASFDNIEISGNAIMFTAKTNEYDSFINLKADPHNKTEIYDQTTQEVVTWELHQDNSINFWVKNGHRYRVSPLLSTNAM